LNNPFRKIYILWRFFVQFFQPSHSTISTISEGKYGIQLAIKTMPSFNFMVSSSENIVLRKRYESNYNNNYNKNDSFWMQYYCIFFII
jgi:hypothetical protein